MAAVGIVSPKRDSQNFEVPSGRRILVENSSKIIMQLALPKRVGSIAQAASPKSPLANRKMVLHPQLFKIVRGKEDFSAKLIAVASFKAGVTICKIEGITRGVPKRYTSLQSGINEHFELNSDLVFMNHSCSPSVHVNVDSMEITAIKNIAPGDELTFFYCSTEYEMDQPFQCWCGAPECVERIAGAKYLSPAQLGRYSVNKHILELLYRSLTQQPKQ